MRRAQTEPRPAPPQPVIIRVPFVIQRRGGRRTMKASGMQHAIRETGAGCASGAFVHALAKAFRWRRLLETGVYSTVAEIAAAERVNDSYVSRILRLTLLAPELVEAVLDHGSAPQGLETAMRPFPIEWSSQRLMLCRTV